MADPLADATRDAVDASIPDILRADRVASCHAAMIRRLIRARPDVSMREANDVLELIEAAGLVLADAGPQSVAERR